MESCLYIYELGRVLNVPSLCVAESREKTSMT